MPMGFLYTMGNITCVNNNNNYTTYYSNYDNMGHAGTMTDPNGNISNITYNWRGQITSITQKGASSSGADLTTSFSYDIKGNLSRVIYPSGAYILYIYDAGDHITSITRYNASGQVVGSIVYTCAYGHGNKTSENVYDAQNNLVRFKNYVYDQYSTLSEIINGNSSATYIGYDGNGNIAGETDPNGHYINYRYNELNKLGQVTQYGSQANALTSYKYNVHGDLITATDANGNTSHYEYDDMSNLVMTSSHDTGDTNYRYNSPAGSLIGKMDADSRELNYAYKDGLNRLTSISPNQGSGFSSVSFVTYYYDGKNPLNISVANGISRLTGMQDSSGNTAYSYDARGNVIAETRSISGHTFVISYTYDNDGNLSSITYPSGRVVNYKYTSDPNKPSEVDEIVNGVNTTIASNITYQPFADLAGLSYGNGLPLTITTDAAGEATDIQVGNILNRAYKYDNAGNVLTITTTPTSYIYNYDAFNRVTDTTGDYGNIEYSYDLVGNRLTQVTSTKTINYLYYPGTNRLWSYNDPIKGTNENSVKRQYRRLIENWEHLIENGIDRRCFKVTKDTDDESSVIARDEVPKQSHNDSDKDDNKTCYTYDSLLWTMANTAKQMNIDMQVFVGVVIQSDDVKSDISAILQRINQRGIDAVLDKTDIKLGKRLFEAMEDVIDHLKGLNPSDPTYLYDAAGYITEETVSGEQFQYDSMGRLTNVLDANNTAIGQYIYDGMNRRIIKTALGKTTIYLYDIYNNLIGEYDGSSGSMNAEYVYLGNKPLAEVIPPPPPAPVYQGCGSTFITSGDRNSFLTAEDIFDRLIYLLPLMSIAVIIALRRARRGRFDLISLLAIGSMIILVVMISRQTQAQVSGEQVYYYHLDHLGTPIMMTDASQNIVWQASYDPFGQATVSVSTVTNNLRFPGMYADAETGFYYNMNRYYYPAIGRYIEPDPFNVASSYINLMTLIKYRIQEAYMSGHIPSYDEPINLHLTNKPYMDLLQQPGLQVSYIYALNNPTNNTDPTGLYCIYSQSRGSIICWPNYGGFVPYTECNQGYSGQGRGLNNPSMQGVPNTGPIPQGPWETGIPIDRPRMGPYSIPLSPVPGAPVFDTNRDPYSFWIHGPGPHGSEGCIILPAPIRSTIPPGEPIYVGP